jgi:hypothetical protein
MTTLERCQLAKERGYTYCPVSGEIKGIYGKLITRKDHQGYTMVQLIIEGKSYFIIGHRLAWFLHYGTLPNNSIDHIDGDRSNNKIDNLRDVTNQQNQWNRTTAKGYSWNKNANKFQAKIHINGNIKHLGYYTTEQEARNAYLKAKEIYHVINA